MQGIRLELHFSESIIHHVTNRNDSDEPAALAHSFSMPSRGRIDLGQKVEAGHVGWLGASGPV
jgi:hypothetical protein